MGQHRRAPLERRLIEPQPRRAPHAQRAAEQQREGATGELADRDGQQQGRLEDELEGELLAATEAVALLEVSCGPIRCLGELGAVMRTRSAEDLAGQHI